MSLSTSNIGVLQGETTLQGEYTNLYTISTKPSDRARKAARNRSLFRRRINRDHRTRLPRGGGTTVLEKSNNRVLLLLSRSCIVYRTQVSFPTILSCDSIITTQHKLVLEITLVLTTFTLVATSSPRRHRQAYCTHSFTLTRARDSGYSE